ncbi:MAG TPA: LysR family transcriptional regulator [Candidatus Blautia excrementipullorum]|nr:LysR family transcriptional regulator [Candidatus Blautia excrementipullorum]
MEFRLLEYFLAVAREQNITAAAESLHISQPALSTQLKALETELGKQLLIRGVKGSRKVVLTEEGMILRKRAEEMISLMRRTEEEITGSNDTIAGNVFIGAGETETVRLFAQVAKKLQQKYPDIRYHISSGNAEHVLEYLDKGLIDFGLLFTEIDLQKYEAVPVPIKDIWGVLMRRDSPLAEKEAICPEDLWDKPLIVSHQKGDNIYLGRWIKREESELHIVATYNLIFNASLLVDEGLGYALCYDKLINTQGSNLCFRPFSPRLEARGFIVWKKYQIFSKASKVFIDYLKKEIQKKGCICTGI